MAVRAAYLVKTIFLSPHSRNIVSAVMIIVTVVHLNTEEYVGVVDHHAVSEGMRLIKQYALLLSER